MNLGIYYNIVICHKEYIKIAKSIKQKLNLPIIWGGPHATFFPKIIEEDYIKGLLSFFNEINVPIIFLLTYTNLVILTTTKR